MRGSTASRRRSVPRRLGRSAAPMLGVLLSVAMLAGGCAETAPVPSGAPSVAAPRPADPPESSVDWASAEVHMEIVQLRGDVASGHIELRVTNGADAALTVVRATYESSRWAEPMVRQDDAAIPPGQRRNLRLQLPEPTCDGAPIEHLATLELADGTTLEQVPADAIGQLERLGEDACSLRQFEQQVAAVTWLEPSIPADGSGPAVLRLELAPLAEPSGQLGAIDAVAATVLLTPVDASGTRIEHLPVGLQLRGGDAPAVVEVPLAPGRCDLHAIAEDKQGTLFRILATVGDEPTQLVLPSPDAQREALLDWTVARCAAQP